MRFTVIILFVFTFSCAENKTDHTNATSVPKESPEVVIIEKSDDLKSTTKPKLRNRIKKYAENLLGTDYCYAGNTPEEGFDCSGFVNYVFKNFDVELPRSSSSFKNLGTALTPEEFRVGDVLVFYGYRDSTRVGHLGIVYEADGMNSTFIHASSGKQNSVIISDLNSAMYTRRFYKCIDVLKLK